MSDDYISEGEALSLNLEGCDDDDWLGMRAKQEAHDALYHVVRTEHVKRIGANAREWRLKFYNATKAAKVGETVCCAGCGKKFVKRTYQHPFCRNKGRNNCKDKYWNCATDERWLRTVDHLINQ